MRAAVAKLDFGPLTERAPVAVVPLEKEGTFATNLLLATVSPKTRPLTARAKPARSGASKSRGDWI